MTILEPDKTEAARFLKNLDPRAAFFTFQTFDDNNERKDGRLAHLLHGTLEQHWDFLVRLNERGAGIFVTINQTDGRGRSAENIIRVRAVFTDLDGAPLEPVMQIKFPPHIVTETSPGRWHAYWRVDDLPLDQFTAVQKGIAARFNGDPAVCDLPRVMRLPGFLHRKGVPYPVRIKTIQEQPAYPGAIFKRSKTSKPQPNAELVADENRVACAVAFIPNNEVVDWKAWSDFGLAIFGATAGSDKGFAIFDAWSRRCPSQYNERDTRDAWARFKKSPPDRVGAGTIFFLANKAYPRWADLLDDGDDGANAVVAVFIATIRVTS